MLRIQRAVFCSLLLATLVLANAREPSPADYEEALQVGERYITNRNRIEDILEDQCDKNSIHAMIARFRPVDRIAVAESKEVSKRLIAREFLRSKGFTGEFDFDKADTSKHDKRQLSCDPGYPFRSYDGSCNNLNRPKFGLAGTIFQRLAPPSYKDGVSAPRLLDPSPRVVSTTVTVNESIPVKDVSLVTMQWGQFLDHDLTSTPTATTSTGGLINCCSSILIGNTLASPAHPECMPISIPFGDTAYTTQNCMSFVRSTYGQNLDGSIPPNREQINSNTHWMDGSQVYGSSDTVAQSLRDKTAAKGLMKTSVQNGRVLLPLGTTCCPGDSTNTCAAAASCFVAGDSRVAEQPLLTIMHTLWVREHNRIASRLAAQFPGNTDEFYYQQARRIVIAELQHITYTEYLPTLIGRQMASRIMTSTATNYRPNANPAIFNEFAAAAYRMGHSQLKSFIRLFQADGRRSNDSFFLSDSFFTASKLLLPNFIDNALRGLTRTPIQAVDNNFADDVTSGLFKGFTGTSLGMDLVSLNIQRGRDHGLPPYIGLWQASQMDQMPGGLQHPADGFDSLRATTSPEIIAYFRSIYQSVNDIDLYIGGVTEDPLPGALVGPTFARIIARQFDNLKHADRFFYNDLSQPGSLTPGQLEEIRKTSLARIFCDNSDGTIDRIQPNVFRTAGPHNEPISCNRIPVIDFSKLQPPPPPPPVG